MRLHLFRPFIAGLALATGAAAAPVPLLLVSLDGFRWDYCAQHPAETPNLRRFEREGISSAELIPTFPSLTFPIHYSIVTGLYPAHHGVIGNHMFDPAMGRFFHFTQAADNRLSAWWGGEPIWITAQRQGLKAASSYWVGSEAEGRRPTYFRHFDAALYHSEPFESRIAEVVRWLRLPEAERPSTVTFYMSEVDSAGHKFGPDSSELTAAVKVVDQRLGALVDRLGAEHLPINLVVVSDHGMTPVSPDRILVLDDFVDASAVQVDFQSSTMGLRPLKGTAAELARSLQVMPHARVYLSREPSDGHAPPESEMLPARFHMSGNPRIPDVWVVPDEGWRVLTRASATSASTLNERGDHGYDPALRSMHGILIADGPSFRTGGQVEEPVENIHIYNLLCAALGLKPAPNDGDDRLVREFLR
jgi:predicted AlkP superfamily pyrophosphatase or phosphodiesterase